MKLQSRPFGRLLLVLIILGAAGCREDGLVGPEEELAPFVGTWDARSLVVTSKANPELSVDLLNAGSEFFIAIQPSGSYTAHLNFQGTPLPAEVGEIEVQSASRLVLHRTILSERDDSGTYSFSGGKLLLNADTEFPFDLSTSTPATLSAELVRR